MSAPKENEKEVLWNASGNRARATLQLFRQQLQAHAQVPAVDPEAAPRRKSPAKKPAAKLSVAELPADLRRLLKQYEEAHPDIRVEPVSYMISGASGEAAMKLDPSELPHEDELVVLSVTETTASAKQIEARSHVLVARARPAE